MQLKDWQDKIQRLKETDRAKYAEAIFTLMGWKDFAEEFGWTGLMILEFELSGTAKGLNKEINVPPVEWSTQKGQ